MLAVGPRRCLVDCAWRTVKQDTQPVSVNFVQLETLLGKEDVYKRQAAAIAAILVQMMVLLICFMSQGQSTVRCV